MTQFQTQKLSSFGCKNREDKQDFERCKNKFSDSFIRYVRNSYNGPGSIRQGLFKMNSFFSLKGTTFNGRSKLGSIRPLCFQKCARITTCQRYHMYDIDEIFSKLTLNNNTQQFQFKCVQQGCKGYATQTKHIVPDYMCYLFFAVSQGVPIEILFLKEQKQGISQAVKTEIMQIDNQLLMNNDTLLITLEFDNMNKAFKDTINLLEHIDMKTVYTAIKKDQYTVNLRSSSLDRKFGNLGTTSFGVVSLISGKRMRSGVLHRDCIMHQEVYVFDLEGLILSLFEYTKNGKKNIPLKQVQCIYCSSQFTKQNLLQKAMYCQKICDIIAQQPYLCGRIYYQNNIKLRRQQQNIIQQKERVKTRNPGKENQLKDAFSEMVTYSVGFWNAQQMSKYLKFLKTAEDKAKTANKLNGPFLKTIDYSKVFYPIRCKDCNSLDFVDLWDEIIHFIELRQLQTCTDQKCLVCKKKFAQDIEFNELFYLDIQVYKLMQYRLLQIGYYPRESRWLPNIKQIKFKQGEKRDPVSFLIMYLKLNNKIGDQTTLNILPYYQMRFKINKEISRNTQSFVLDQCMRSQNFQNLHEHVIFIETGRPFQIKCPKCKREPQSILNITYDKSLATNLKDGRNQWNNHSNQFERAVLNNSFQNIPQTNELDFIKNMYQQQYKNLAGAFRRNPNVSKKWQLKQLKEYAGGISTYTQQRINKLQIGH